LFGSGGGSCFAGTGLTWGFILLLWEIGGEEGALLGRESAEDDPFNGFLFVGNGGGPLDTERFLVDNVTGGGESDFWGIVGFDKGSGGGNEDKFRVVTVGELVAPGPTTSVFSLHGTTPECVLRREGFVGTGGGQLVL